ncbi:MAG: hypothetical protein AAF571_13270 [Verrucomicrobiota bacterium]
MTGIVEQVGVLLGGSGSFVNTGVLQPTSLNVTPAVLSPTSGDLGNLQATTNEDTSTSSDAKPWLKWVVLAAVGLAVLLFKRKG